MLDKIRSFSYSQLNTFKACPQKYKIIYLDGVRKKHESIESFMGKIVHISLEWLYGLENREIIFDKLSDKYDREWSVHWHDKIFIADIYNNVDYYYSEGKKCLSNYFNKFYPFNQDVESTELKLEFKIEKYLFKGIIDRLDRNGFGNWIVHDYKTSKHTKSERQVFNDIQLVLYQIALEQNFDNVNKVSLNWHFLRTGKEYKIIYSRDQIKKVSRTIIKSINKIIDCLDNNSKFIPKESRLCDWCYLWEECAIKNGPNHVKRAK